MKGETVSTILNVDRALTEFRAARNADAIWHLHVKIFVTAQEYDEPMPSEPNADLRDYLAAERTLLAWVRTGLALMGFGFVVARFGLFLQEFQLAERALQRCVTGFPCGSARR